MTEADLPTPFVGASLSVGKKTSPAAVYEREAGKVDIELVDIENERIAQLFPGRKIDLTDEREFPGSGSSFEHARL